MTQTEIQLEKAYLAEMIDIASEIMEKKQSVDPDSLQYKRRNIRVLTHTNMKNEVIQATLWKNQKFILLYLKS